MSFLPTTAGHVLEAQNVSKTSEANASVLRERAEATRASQELLEEQKRKVIKSNIATQTATYASSGIKMSGTAIDVITDSLANSEMDIAIDKYNSEIESRGLEEQANITLSEGRRARSIGYVKAAGSFISGVAQTLGTGGFA